MSTQERQREDYKLYDKVAGGYRTMKVYDDQSEVYRSERAEHKDIRFIYGPRLVKIYASAGLENPTSNQNLENQEDGNGFIKYTFIATIESGDGLSRRIDRLYRIFEYARL